MKNKSFGLLTAFVNFGWFSKVEFALDGFEHTACQGVEDRLVSFKQNLHDDGVQNDRA